VSIVPSSDWPGTVDAILTGGVRSVMVLGSGDVGKSTFARWLGERLVAAGRSVALIDSDLGQKIIGPPATVTHGRAAPAGDGRALQLADIQFVGRTHPIGVAASVLAGLARLRAAAVADVVVIDTCGLVSGAGLELKQAKLDLIAPELVCALEKAGELAPLLQGNRHRRIVRLRPAGRVRPKSSAERRAARAAAFAAHFCTGRAITLEVDRLAFQRSPLFVGTPVAVDGAVYAERIGSAVVAVAPPGAPAPPGTRRLRHDFARSLLCGLAGDDGRGLALGLIEEIDFARRTLTVTTAAEADAIRTVRLGDLYVDRGGAEIGRADFAGLLPG